MLLVCIIKHIIETPSVLIVVQNTRWPIGMSLGTTSCIRLPPAAHGVVVAVVVVVVIVVFMVEVVIVVFVLFIVAAV